MSRHCSIHLEPKIVALLQSDIPSHWTSLASHTRRSYHRPKEAKRPTVLISFRGGAVAGFGTLERKVKGILESEGINLGLEFLCGSVYSGGRV